MEVSSDLKEGEEYLKNMKHQSNQWVGKLRLPEIEVALITAVITARCTRLITSSQFILPFFRLVRTDDRKNKHLNSNPHVRRSGVNSSHVRSYWTMEKNSHNTAPKLEKRPIRYIPYCPKCHGMVPCQPIKTSTVSMEIFTWLIANRNLRISE